MLIFSLMSPETNEMSDFDSRREQLRRSQMIAQRRELLRLHPELHRTLDLEKLRQVVDFDEIRVAAGSSVARNEAIEGSDIDGAMVITRRPVKLISRLRFVRELRLQSFRAADISELQAAARRYERKSSSRPDDSWFLSEEHRELFRQKEEAEATLVRFYSRRQIQTHLKNKDFPGSGDLVYRTGAVIK